MLQTALFCFKIALNYSQHSHISNPNPHVGTVLWHRQQQKVIGIGRTQNYGGAHAEFIAIETAQAQGIDLTQCTLFVTLEPCAHHGKTPPCVDKIIQAGITEVCVLLKDPYPKVNGKGIEILRQHGIKTYYLEDLLTQATPLAEQEQVQQLKSDAELQMAGFLKFQNTGKPWVRLKFAISLDGFMALENGTSKWLTSDLARAHNQSLRARADVVLSTLKTVVADNAKLNVRLAELLYFFDMQLLRQDLSKVDHQYISPLVLAQMNDRDDFIKLSTQAKMPMRWVLDRSGQLLSQNFHQQYPDLAILQNISNPDVFAVTHQSINPSTSTSTSTSTELFFNFNHKLNIIPIHPDHLQKLPSIDQSNQNNQNNQANQIIDIEKLIEQAAALDIQEIHIEAGPALTKHIIENQLFDELAIYQAPILLGGGLSPWPQHLNYQGMQNLAGAHDQALKLQQVLQFGEDVCLRYVL